jgi:hypothetical protein
MLSITPRRAGAVRALPWPSVAPPAADVADVRSNDHGACVIADDDGSARLLAAWQRDGEVPPDAQLPFDALKIDRSFIRGLPGDTHDAAITEAIVVMGRTLQLTVVAEGVETGAQREFLRRLGCTQMQDYQFSKPLPAADFAALAREHFATADAC